MPDYKDIGSVGSTSSLVPRRAFLPPSEGQPAGGGAARSSGPEQQPATRTFRELSDAQKREVQRLRLRDAEVRRHEQAHIAAGGQYVRGRAAYSYTRGPDGRQYATGGEVSMDVGEERTPEATIRKMQVIRRAALAPESPSPQDRRVAAEAARIESRARQELARTRDSRTREDAPSGAAFDGDSAGGSLAPLPPPPRRAVRPSDVSGPSVDNAERTRRPGRAAGGIPSSVLSSFQLVVGIFSEGPGLIDYRV